MERCVRWRIDSEGQDVLYQECIIFVPSTAGLLEFVLGSRFSPNVSYPSIIKRIAQTKPNEKDKQSTTGYFIHGAAICSTPSLPPRI